MFTFNHFNFNVLDLNKSLDFIIRLLALRKYAEKKRKTAVGYLCI